MQYEHLTRVGRYTVIDMANVTETLFDGSAGITAKELARLERRAAITVLAEVDEIAGGELKFARKALDLSQADLARQLGVTTETVCRWETGKEAFKRQTQLAVLRLLEQAERAGEGLQPRAVRAPDDFMLRAKAS